MKKAPGLGPAGPKKTCARSSLLLIGWSTIENEPLKCKFLPLFLNFYRSFYTCPEHFYSFYFPSIELRHYFFIDIMLRCNTMQCMGLFSVIKQPHILIQLVYRKAACFSFPYVSFVWGNLHWWRRQGWAGVGSAHPEIFFD